MTPSSPDVTLAPPGTLRLPEDLASAPGASEFARIWMTDEGDTMILNITSDLQPGMVGMLAVDFLRHAARAFEQQGTHTRQAAFQEALHYFTMELKEPTAEL